MLPPAFRLPHGATAIDAWLAWLDANRLTPAAARALPHDVRVPAEVRAHLDAAYAQARAQWLLRKTALQRFLALMAQEPARPVILLKGAALALTLYEDPAMRPMNDVDVLIEPEHLMIAVEWTRQAGYEERSLGAGDDAGYLHHFIFIDPATNVRFELHRTLPLLPDDKALDWFLHHRTPHEFVELPFSAFTPEAQLLHTSSHAVLEHGGAQGAIAIWLYDIDQLIRRWGKVMDWEETLDQARALAWEAALHESIRLARLYFATPLPPMLREWLQLPQAELSGYNIMRQMTSPARSSSLTVFHILRGLTWQQRARQVMSMIFPTRIYLRHRYPGIPWPLAYPYRWFDAARKLLPALFRK